MRPHGPPLLRLIAARRFYVVWKTFFHTVEKMTKVSTFRGKPSVPPRQPIMLQCKVGPFAFTLHPFTITAERHHQQVAVSTAR